MFVLLTAGTLVLLTITDSSFFGSKVTAHDITAFSVFRPTLPAEYLLLGVWVLIALIVFVNGMVLPKKKASWVDYLAKFGALDYIGWLDTILLIGALILSGVGWFIGVTAFFMPGCILTVGLVANRIEQAMAL